MVLLLLITPLVALLYEAGRQIGSGKSIVLAGIAFLVQSAALIFLLRRSSSSHQNQEKPLPGGIAPDGGKNSESASSVDAYTRSLLEQNSELASFNFTISHEIKAPVRAIDGYARIFLEDYGEKIDPEARDMIENIRNICYETITLSNKLLEYTRIVSEAPYNEIVDLGAMISQVFETMHAVQDESIHIRLEFATPIPYIIADPVLLRQAVVNILSNCFKFTRDKPDGVIIAGCDLQEEESIFYIRDNGAGFDMRFSEKLFGMFQRMHTSDEFEGTGIGLAIVKKIIRLHNGRVWITGEVGRGATIYFTFPSEKVLR